MKTVIRAMAFCAAVCLSGPSFAKNYDSDDQGTGYYATDDGKYHVNCDGYDPNGNWVPCPKEKSTFDGLSEQYKDTMEKVKNAFTYPKFEPLQE